MKFLIGVLIVVMVGAGFFLFTIKPEVLTIASINTHNTPSIQVKKSTTTVQLTSVASTATHLPTPLVVHGLYVTSWVAGIPSRVDSLIALAKARNINAMVVDIKDYSGYVAYKTSVPAIGESGAQKWLRVRDINALLEKLHRNTIYVIARITVFQDPILANAHPEWALQSSSTGAVWTDRKGLAWMDPAAEQVWEYNAALAKDAYSRGFDEIQFDYVRFPSDGDVREIRYPVWDATTPKHKVINNFFTYLRKELSGIPISVDLFGLSTVDMTDLGVGQIIEDAYANFDYVSPMVYPSHYAYGFIGYENPAQYPYEVIMYSMEKALQRLTTYDKQLTTNTTSTIDTTAESPVISHKLSVVAKLRPWLQVFDLGATYDGAMIQKEIQAVEDSLLRGPHPATFNGWLLWDPQNMYENFNG